jgi:hypothetical protein
MAKRSQGTNFSFVLVLVLTLFLSSPVASNPRRPNATQTDKLLYSSLVGGNSADTIYDITVDEDGNLYATGWTESKDFPLKEPILSIFQGNQQAFVAKISPDGKLLWSTFIGGTGKEYGRAIAIDAHRNVYVAGYCEESGENFPLHNAWDSTFKGNCMAFLTVINSDGKEWIYSTFLGGRGLDHAYDLCVDQEGKVYITGRTYSRDFPVKNAFDQKPSGPFKAFVSSFSPEGKLVFSSYLGGNDEDKGWGVAIRKDGKLVLSGWTKSADFPLIKAIDTDFNKGFSKVYVALLCLDSHQLTYATFIGGSKDDVCRCMDLDSNDNIYIGGYTYSMDFPLHNAFDNSFAGEFEGFVFRLSSSGDKLDFSSYYGGNNIEKVRAMKISTSDHIWLGGFTVSYDFPLKKPWRRNLWKPEAFLSKISPEGELLFSTFWGGSNNDRAHGIAVLNDHFIYLAGETASQDFPLLQAFDDQCHDFDGFISAWNLEN